MLEVKSFVTGALATNVYLIWDASTLETMLVDPGMDSEEAASAAKDLDLSPKYILNTHCHFDHTWLNGFFRRLWGVELIYHPLDEPVLDRSPKAAQEWGFPPMEPSPHADHYCEEGDVFTLGAEELSVLHLPGHRPGHIGLVASIGELTGDVLFAGSVGRWDFPGGDRLALLASIRGKLLNLSAKTVVYPGHGPTTTIGEEANSNPYLNDPFL